MLNHELAVLAICSELAPAPGPRKLGEAIQGIEEMPE